MVALALEVRALTVEEIEIVAGAPGPVGAVIGGVVGGLSGAGSAMASGGSFGSIVGGAVGGAAVGGATGWFIPGGTAGLAAVRGMIHAGQGGLWAGGIAGLVGGASFPKNKLK
jgi:hypothetical protein